MKRKSAIKKLPAYYDRYITKVPDIDIIEALEIYGRKYFDAERAHLDSLGDKVYQEHKWTMKDIIQHLIDTERIFTYRALRFARRDNTALPGFDENHFADMAKTSRRTLEELLCEFDLVRKSTTALISSLNHDELSQEGSMSENKISVLALCFTIVGHPIHHLEIIKERYFPLINNI